MDDNIMKEVYSMKGRFDAIENSLSELKNDLHEMSERLETLSYDYQKRKDKSEFWSNNWWKIFSAFALFVGGIGGVGAVLDYMHYLRNLDPHA